MSLSKWMATCLGIGYIQKGAGTLAALFCCLFWCGFRVYKTTPVEQALHIFVLFFAGVWVSANVEKAWGHDSNRVVIDEWLGMSVALFLLPFSWLHYSLAFVLFRFFDIAKPLGVRKMEALPGGWGVMMDDLLAGIYSRLVLLLLVNVFSF